jgi:hypothetical protein
MATTLDTIRTRVRKHLRETTASYWTDAELLEHEVACVLDLWGDAIQINPDHPHFLTVDTTNVSLAASSSTLTGVPADVHRVNLIEPRDTSSSSDTRFLQFVPRAYNHPEFIAARSIGAQDTNNPSVIYYAIMNAGGPVAAPTIRVAPQVTAAVNLTLVYTHTLASADLEAGDNNPIPGESDNALYAWTIAYARAKERDDNSPDPNWLAVYATEKQNIMARLIPRQDQEPEYVDDVFKGVGSYWSY